VKNTNNIKNKKNGGAFVEYKIKSVAMYNGHSIKTNKMIDLGFKFAADELQNCLKLIPCFNSNIEIYAKMSNIQNTLKLGTLMIKDYKIDKDANTTIKFHSQIDFVEINNISKLVGDELIKLMFKADLELEEDGNESN